MKLNEESLRDWSALIRAIFFFETLRSGDLNFTVRFFKTHLIFKTPDEHDIEVMQRLLSMPTVLTLDLQKIFPMIAASNTIDVIEVMPPLPKLSGKQVLVQLLDPDFFSYFKEINAWEDDGETLIAQLPTVQEYSKRALWDGYISCLSRALGGHSFRMMRAAMSSEYIHLYELYRNQQMTRAPGYSKQILGITGNYFFFNYKALLKFIYPPVFKPVSSEANCYKLEIEHLIYYINSLLMPYAHYAHDTLDHKQIKLQTDIIPSPVLFRWKYQINNLLTENIHFEYQKKCTLRFEDAKEARETLQYYDAISPKSR